MLKRPTSDKPRLTRRQMSRARQEARIRQGIVIGTIVIAVLVVGVLAYALINEYIIKPNRVIVSVNGDEMTANVFEDRVKFNYYLQTGGQPIEQLGLDKFFFAELTLNNIIDEMLIMQQAAERGITVSDAEVQEELELTFGYDAGEPEPTSTPVPTEEVLEPTVTPTFVITLTPSPTPTLAPGVTPTATPSGPPTATPTALPLPTAAPMTEEEFNAELDGFISTASRVTGLSQSRVRELLVEQIRIGLLQRRLLDALDLEVDEVKTMVHAAHILVETEEEAQAVLERLEAGEVFEELAAELSIDQSNAYRGGDLGWLDRGDTVEAFEEVAFALGEGEISDPVETTFGWHIIKVYERNENVPLSEAERQQRIRQAFFALLDEWEEEADIVRADNWQNFVPDLP